MEGLEFIERLKELASNEDVLSVSKDVNELRAKFEDFTIEEERKIQVAELEAEEAKETVNFDEQKAEILGWKDDFSELFQQYLAAKKELIAQRDATEESNLIAKTALIKQLREVVNTEENIGAAFGSLKEIQEKWKEIGEMPRGKRNEIETEYSHLLDDFFYNIKIYKDLKEHDFHRNHQLKKELIEELKKLNSLESIKEVEAQMKKLQNDWNDIGPVPNEEWEQLKEVYWTEIRSLYNKINRYYDDQRALQQANLEKKQALLEETAALVATHTELDHVKDWDKATKTLIGFQKQWKEIGRGPHKENEVIWKAFRAQCDVFFDAKKEFFGSVNEQYDEIANKKKGLIAKAKELSTSIDWKETANQLKRLQQQWKQLGHSGAKNEQKLWKDFRGACDAFFNARTAHFGAQDKAFEDNLATKQALLKTIESYTPAADKKQALADLKQFASDFNAIGRVPLKQKDGIFKAFKELMDKHYGALKMEGAEKERVLFEAKIETLQASPNAGRLLNDVKFDIRKEIDKQHKEIAQLENNLGFFANSKGAEALKKDVEKKVQRAKDKIDELKSKLKMIPNE